MIDLASFINMIMFFITIIYSYDKLLMPQLKENSHDITGCC